jgi:hypothetical protein
MGTELISNKKVDRLLEEIISLQIQQNHPPNPSIKSQDYEGGGGGGAAS